MYSIYSIYPLLSESAEFCRRHDKNVGGLLFIVSHQSVLWHLLFYGVCFIESLCRINRWLRVDVPWSTSGRGCSSTSRWRQPVAAPSRCPCRQIARRVSAADRSLSQCLLRREEAPLGSARLGPPACSKCPLPPRRGLCLRLRRVSPTDTRFPRRCRRVNNH